jgi:membrane fusion protein (multidrug efflux system)
MCVQLEQAQVDNAAVIPQQSVTRNEKVTVLVVAEDGTVAPRPCRSMVTRQQLDRDGGLKEGEKSWWTA